MTQWDIEIGSTTSRTALHERFGGSRSRGISVPARGSSRTNIMLFWKPNLGERWGYRDGWTESGSRFFFTGMGQKGDQTFGGHTPENGRVLNHRQDRMSVRLLRSVGTDSVTYEAQLQLVDAFYLSATDEFGNPRQVIQFQFEPVGDCIPFRHAVKEDEIQARSTPVPVTTPNQIGPAPREIDRVGARQFNQVRRQIAIKARRAEAELVLSFAEWMGARDTTVLALDIPYDPERRMLRVDAYIEGRPALLIEAKASVSREAIRMAIGQVLDYARYSPDCSIAVLLPDEPPDDMKDLVQLTNNMPFVNMAGTIWKTASGFDSAGINLSDFWAEHRH